VNRILTLLCCFFLCSIPGLAQKRSSKPPMSDQQFVNFAGQTDMVDANLAQLARTAAPSRPVKDYAQKLVTDQTSDFQALSKVAHQSSFNLPSAIDQEHNRSVIAPFQKLKGTDFDRRFVSEMVAGDIKAIDIYKKEAADARAPALKSYAEEALPILQADLADAKKLEAANAPAHKG
jgi:putative membrane protein